MTRHVERRVWGNGLGIALSCSECQQPLAHFISTAYGVRATCGCPDVRWTAVTEGPAIEPFWVPEKRHPMTMAGTPKQATEPLDVAGIPVIADERVPPEQLRIVSTRPLCTDPLCADPHCPDLEP